MSPHLASANPILTSHPLSPLHEFVCTCFTLNFMNREKLHIIPSIAVFGILAVLRYQIIVIPTILQEGISLFGKQPEEIVLRLVGTTDYNGMAALLYEPRPIETKNVP